jgi:hypothetical protein
LGVTAAIVEAPWGTPIKEERKKSNRRFPIPGAVNNAGNPDVISFNAVHDAIGTVNDFPAVMISDFRDNST